MSAALTASAARALTVQDFPNGLKWIHRPVTHNQIVAIELFLPGGVVDETAAQAGLTRLTTAAMVKGTEKRSALELAQAMESLGASFGVDAQPDFLAMGGQVTSDNWGPTFDLFEDILLHPAFAEDEVEKEREALLNVLRTSHEHIFNVAEERLRKELFGDHPYGRPEEGSEPTVRALTREDLVQWHRRCFRPEGAVLVTVGAVPMQEMSPCIAALARRWTSAALSPRSAGQVRYPSAPVTVVETPHFEQSYVMVGFPAPAVTDRRYPVMKLMNALLGGGMSSPLFRVVREEGTLAYEVSSFYPSRRQGSAFVVYAGMDPANRTLAEEKMRQVLSEFAAAPPSDQDLADAKNYIRGHYLMDHQTNARIAWYLGWWELLGKGHGYDAQYSQDVSGVKSSEIHALAREILNSPSVTIRVASQPSAPR